MQAIDGLAQYVSRQLKKKKSCKVLNSKLAKVWPYLATERDYQISQLKAFAAKNGWTVKLVITEITATFEPAASPTSPRRQKKR